jgi:KUP system potassium uptake protein
LGPELQAKGVRWFEEPVSSDDLAGPAGSASTWPYAVPLAVVVTCGVFVLQQIGSGRIGWLYGPVLLVWFAVIAAVAAASLTRNPEALQAISPHWAVRFVVVEPGTAFVALASVVLAITGAEALFADRGHFGRAAIRRSWFFLVFPALLITYLGEAASIETDHASANDPFWAVVPSWATVPMLVIATLATIIASESVVAGAFTVLHQAGLHQAGGLGLFPYLRARHPSAQHGGQIYVPAANWAPAASVLLVVLLFRSSERLASAYGLAVSATILVTVTLYLGLADARGWRIRRFAAVPLFGVVVIFFLATLPKFVSGGWLPVAIGALVLTVMSTWWSGQRVLSAARRKDEPHAHGLVERP